MLEDPLCDELREGVAEGDCVPEEVPLTDTDSVALPLPEALPVMVAVEVPLKETLAVSEKETVPLAEGDSLSAGVEVAVEDGDWLDDPLSDLDMLELVLVEPDAVPDIDDEELAEEDPETVPLGVLDSFELWLPLSVEEGVDVSVEDLLWEWEDERLLLNDSEEDGLIASDKVGEPLDVCVPVSVGVVESELLIELLTDGLVEEEALSVCEKLRLSLPDRELVWLLVGEPLFVGDGVTVSLSV